MAHQHNEHEIEVHVSELKEKREKKKNLIKIVDKWNMNKIIQYTCWRRFRYVNEKYF